jgi:glycerophosphoryl diester phosphodiesterase
MNTYRESLSAHAVACFEFVKPLESVGMQGPLIIAHRTSPAYAPENSLQGIRVSFEQGADGVEVDLRMSLDLRPFLMHDNSMHRTTGWPLPVELTPSFLVRKQRLKAGPTLRPMPRQAGGPAGESASGAVIESRPAPDQPARRAAESGADARDYAEAGPPPTLEEAIASVPVDKVLAVDVKTPWSVFALAGTVARHAMQARTLVWCSSAMVVRYAVRRMPGVEVAYYKDYEDGPSNIEFIGKAGRIGAHAVSLDWRGINRDIVGAAHALGLKVYSWHKELPLTAEKLESGLDGLITDQPAMAREALRDLIS